MEPRGSAAIAAVSALGDPHRGRLYDAARGPPGCRCRGERRRKPGCVRLANCPFHPVTRCAPALVCGINVDYLTGLLEGLDIDSLSVGFEQVPGECCVEVRVGR